MAQEYDIIVVGGGISGLTAGKVASAAGAKTMILIGRALGGHLVTIEKIDGLPEKDEKFSGKTPTDVFEQTVKLFIKLSGLCKCLGRV